MGGRVRGFHFKLVVGSLLGAEALFPEHARRVAAMQDGDWYDYDEFLRMVHELASRLEPAALAYAGAAMVSASRPLFEAQGFSRCEDVLKRIEVMFGANILDAEPRQAVRTVRFEPGFACIEAGAAAEPILLEGCLRGLVEMYGAFVVELRTEAADGPQGRVHRVSIRWETGENPQGR